MMTTAPGDHPAGLLRAGWRRPLYIWVENPRLDYLVVGAVAIWLGIGLATNSHLLLTGIPQDERRLVLQVIVTVSATLLGFVLTSVSILINLLRTPLSRLDQLLTTGQRRSIGQVLLAGVAALGGAFVTALVGLLTDATRHHGTTWVEFLVISFVIAVACHVTRILWVLGRLLRVTTNP